jgi:non-canonical (house-cleaning) NTP pyrophosphatase
MNVLLLSESKDDFYAVKSVFNNNEHWNIITSNIGSHKATGRRVNKQPFGLVETTKGCNDRLDEALRVGGDFPYIVSVENGICKIADKLWVDIGVVCVYNTESEQKFYSTTQGVRFYHVVCERAQRRDFKSVTVNEVNAENMEDCGPSYPDSPEYDPKDPHSYLTNGAVSKSQLIADSIRVCIGQEKISRRNFFQYTDHHPLLNL